MLSSTGSRFSILVTTFLCVSSGSLSSRCCAEERLALDSGLINVVQLADEQPENVNPEEPSGSTESDAAEKGAEKPASADAEKPDAALPRRGGMSRTLEVTIILGVSLLIATVIAWSLALRTAETNAKLLGRELDKEGENADKDASESDATAAASDTSVEKTTTDESHSS